MIGWTDFHKEKGQIRQTISRERGLVQPPVLYGLNVGRSLPITLLPYGRMAELDCGTGRFSIWENRFRRRSLSAAIRRGAVFLTAVAGRR